MEPSEQLHAGHRSRMRGRFVRFGDGVFDTYQLLEMLLYYGTPYRDTNPIARRLLMCFHSVGRIFSASERELMEIRGVGDRTAHLLRSLAGFDTFFSTVPPARASDEPLSFREACEHFTATLMTDRERPAVGAIALDNAGRYLTSAVLYQLPYASGGVHADTFLRFAAESGASALMIGHYTPRGASFPAEADRETHKAVCGALSLVGVACAEDIYLTGTLCMRTDGLGRDAISVLPGGRAYAPSTASRLEALLLSLYEPVTDRENAARIAATLATTFDTPARLFSADFDALLACPRIQFAEAVHFRAALALRLRDITDAFRPGACYTDRQVAALLGAHLLSRSSETFFVAVGDGNGALCAVEQVGDGVINRITLIPRMLLDVVVRYDGREIYLAHAHPGGTADPSTQDMEMTASLREIMTAAGIRLRAHYIYAGLRYGDACHPERGTCPTILTGDAALPYPDRPVRRPRKVRGRPPRYRDDTDEITDPYQLQKGKQK